MKTILFCGSLLLVGSLFGQKTKTATAKIKYDQYPSVPVTGMKQLGIQVYTADLPFNKDTLRLYLGNMDIMKSDVEQTSKMKFQALNEITVVGGEGDITIDMAFGEPVIISKEQKTSSCAVPKEGCTQYYYKVKYRLPAVVQARNASGVIDTWELEPEMELQFGNEQLEQHVKTDAGSITSVKVINYTSEVDLNIAFSEMGMASLARKGIVTQLGNMAESVYDRVFYIKASRAFDISYGKGSVTDYTETVTAAEKAVESIENQKFESLSTSIKTWESWLERYDAGNKKAAVNKNVAKGLHTNLSIGYTFLEKFDEARDHLNTALELAQTGNINQNEVNRLKKLGLFIDRRENVKKYNNPDMLSKMITAPDIKKLLGRRKFNADIDFLIAEDKYAEILKNHGSNSPKKDISEMSVDEFMNQSTDATETSDDEEISLDGRVENNMLILSGIVDGNMRGKALPNSICEYPEIEVIRARNIGLISLPDCMNQLIKLEKLYLNSNSFEQLPDCFGGMKNLEVLDISNNNLKSLPPSIYELKQLKKIYISGNQLSDEDISKLKSALPNTSFK